MKELMSGEFKTKHILFGVLLFVMGLIYLLLDCL